jgi:hypothetical protein
MSDQELAPRGIDRKERGVRPLPVLTELSSESVESSCDTSAMSLASQEDIGDQLHGR